MRWLRRLVTQADHVLLERLQHEPNDARSAREVLLSPIRPVEEVRNAGVGCILEVSAEVSADINPECEEDQEIHPESGQRSDRSEAQLRTERIDEAEGE